MSQTELEAIASAYERWVLVANVGLLVAALALAVAVTRYLDAVLAGLVLMVAGLAFLVRFIDGSGTYGLATAKSPDAVRQDFLGADPPVMSVAPRACGRRGPDSRRGRVHSVDALADAYHRVRGHGRRRHNRRLDSTGR